MDKEKILKRIRSMFDVPVMQNSLRGIWVEFLVAELLGRGWTHVGSDWAAWDIERSDGLRVEVKQSATFQSWGKSSTSPRFDIKAAKGYYPDGKTYVPNSSGKRLADLYIFAWHEGDDQRVESEWQFYVVQADKLPTQQKSIGLGGIKKLTTVVSAAELQRRVTHTMG